jgi:hypothetical protein
MRHLALACAVVALVGCGPPPQGQNLPAPVAQVDKVILRVPLNPLRSADGGEEPQGVLVEVFFERADRPGGVPVLGLLEMRMYEGSARPADLADHKPFHVETYPNSALQNLEGRGMFGVSYRIVVPWGARAPSTETIWVEGRYIPPTGPAVLSEPTSVPVRPT